MKQAKTKKPEFFTGHCKNSAERVKTFVGEFIRSEDVQAYQESAISGDFGIDGRFGRCMDAAENGSDGSTHSEVIDDWRGAFSNWLHERAHGGCDGFDRGDRFGAAVRKHFDEVEEWHEKNGSLDRPADE